ncbi:MAG TPA: radical SAM protein [Planctomycetota bacterium]|nr:radical SAM protein [Planctomycetota bacterium]
MTGGEPLLVPHIFDLVHEAKKRVPIVTVHTNFSLVKKRLAELKESEIDMLSISLYEPISVSSRRRPARSRPGSSAASPSW